MGRIKFGDSIGKKNLSQIQEQSLAMKDAPTVIMVSLDKIKENPDNNKIYSRNKEDLTNLKTSIKSNGFFGSIILFEIGNGEYEICSGHRRTRAMMELGESFIPATILPMPDDIKKAELLLANNQNDREKTPMDRAREIQYYMNTHKKELEGQRSRERLAEFFNISPSKVYRYTSLLEVSENLQKLAENDNFPWHTLSEAKTLDKDQQDELYKRITEAGVEDISGPVVKSFIHRIKNGDETENENNIENLTDSKNAAEHIDNRKQDSKKAAKSDSITEDIEEKRIHDIQAFPVSSGKKMYSKAETGRFMAKMNEIADTLDFDNTNIFKDKDETREWYRKFSGLVQEMGNYV